MALIGTEVQKAIMDEDSIYGGSRGFGKSEALRELNKFQFEIQARGTGKKLYDELMEEIRREKNSGQDGTR